MVQFGNLVNDQQNRKIREVITSSGETIHVYEPSLDDIEYIVEMQEKTFDSATNEVKVSGIEMVRILFPRLTNIEGLEEMTDEEVGYIIDNPTVALIQVQHVVEIIITEVYKTVILSAKKSLLEMDFEVESYKAEAGMINQVLAHAGKEGKGRELMNKIEAQSADLKDAVEKQELEREEEGMRPGSAAIAELNAYRNTFKEDSKGE